MSVATSVRRLRDDLAATNQIGVSHVGEINLNDTRKAEKEDLPAWTTTTNAVGRLFLFDVFEHRASSMMRPRFGLAGASPKVFEARYLKMLYVRQRVKAIASSSAGEAPSGMPW